MAEEKLVIGKTLKIGQEVKGYELGNKSVFCTMYVKEITPFKVILTMWKKDGKETEVPIEAKFKVELTEEEVIEKYKNKTAENYKILHNKLNDYEIGYHEMWNGWLSYDLFELTQNLACENLRLVGYCDSITPKHTFYGEIEDIGICVEYDDGTKFWCHSSKKTLDKMLKRYEKYLEREREKEIKKEGK